MYIDVSLTLVKVMLIAHVSRRVANSRCIVGRVCLIVHVVA